MDFGLNSFYQQNITLSDDKNFNVCWLGFASCDLMSLKMHAENFLHTNELRYLETLHYEKRQFSFLLGRYCAKQLVSRHCQKKITEFEITTGIFRQPIITDIDLEISLSHSEKMSAAIAFPRQLILGLDLEVLQPRYATAIQQELVEPEISLLAHTFVNEPIIMGLTIIWTIKEALSKALKTGLTIPLQFLEVHTIERYDNYCFSTFKNFPQYQTITIWMADLVLSIVFPKATIISIDIADLQKHLLHLRAGQSSLIALD